MQRIMLLVVLVLSTKPVLKPQPAQAARQELTQKPTAVRPLSWAELKRRYR